jgi:hypothetical protein
MDHFAESRCILWSAEYDATAFVVSFSPNDSISVEHKFDRLERFPALRCDPYSRFLVCNRSGPVALNGVRSSESYSYSAFGGTRTRPRFAAVFEHDARCVPDLGEGNGSVILCLVELEKPYDVGCGIELEAGNLFSRKFPSLFVFFLQSQIHLVGYGPIDRDRPRRPSQESSIFGCNFSGEW